MGLPIILTQQYTKGLGETVPVILEALDTTGSPFDKIEKTSFSCYGEPTFVTALEQTLRKTVILCGIETHVCVQQTALDLLENGYMVYLIHDCVSSRSNNDKKYAQRRIGEAGAVGTTYEALLFELCVSAKAPEFKAISALVK
jgi:nicotinamidase-related amidase